MNETILKAQWTTSEIATPPTAAYFRAKAIEAFSLALSARNPDDTYCPARFEHELPSVSDGFCCGIKQFEIGAILLRVDASSAETGELIKLDALPFTLTNTLLVPSVTCVNTENPFDYEERTFTRRKYAGIEFWERTA